MTKVFRSAAKWVALSRPELLPFFPLALFDDANVPISLADGASVLKNGLRVRLAASAECLRSVLLHWTSRLPEVTMTRPVSFEDVQDVIRGRDSPATLRRITCTAPLLLDVIAYGRRQSGLEHRQALKSILKTSLLLAAAACKERGEDRPYAPPVDVSAQRMFIQVPEVAFLDQVRFVEVG